MLATYSFLPSGETWIAPGYQPVGIRPTTLLSLWSTFNAASVEAAPSSTTAIQLFVPLATYKVAPSGLRARALEPLPNGKRLWSRHKMVSTTSSEPVSMTEILSLLALATYRNFLP